MKTWAAVLRGPHLCHSDQHVQTGDWKAETSAA